MSRINKRMKKIFHLLKVYPAGITGEEVSKQLGVSSRTIRSDIKALQEVLKEHRAWIESSPSKGYVIQSENENVDSVLHDVFSGVNSNLESPAERVNYIICRLLENALHDKPITQMELADEMFISLSTLKSHLNDVKKRLSKYDITIVQYKSLGVKLSGEETKLRYCISDYIHQNQMNRFYVSVFSGIDMTILDGIVKNVLCHRGLQLTDIAKANLCTHTAIALHRSKMGNSITCARGLIKKIEATFEYSVAKDIAERVYQVMGMEFIHGEVCYIAQCLLASKKFMDIGNSPDKDHVKDTVMMILKEIQDKLGIDFTGDECLVDGLALHLYIALTRIRFQMNIRNELLETIKNDYPLAFQMGVIAGKVIAHMDQLKVSENEIGYIALHFGAAMGRRVVQKELTIKRGAIVCSAGLGMSILLKAKIAEHFHNQVVIVRTIPGYEVNESLLSEVDFILTTVPLDHMNADKVIRIHNILTQEDIEKIERLVCPKEKISRACLESFFPVDCFYVGQTFQDKKTCLEFLTDQAIEKGLMTQKTKSSVFEREEVSTTAIGSLVAIPHPVYNDTNRSFISVLILDKPIAWDENLVQVVFLLNIEKGESELWEMIFLKLYHYIKSNSGINSMLANQSYAVFLEEFAHMF